MTDKEEICAEIEKLRKEYDIDTTPIAKYQIAQAILNRLSDVIDSLREEPVSEDLDRAAEKYAYELFPSIGAANTETELAFKAGANWKEQQMMKAAIDTQVVLGPNDNHVLMNGLFNNYKYHDKVKLIIIKED